MNDYSYKDIILPVYQKDTAYLTLTMKLKDHEKEYDRIYRNHGTCTNDKKLLDNVLECCNLILVKEDDQCPVEMYGRTLYAARSAVDGIRIDGKEGNIIYAPEKSFL